MGHKPSADHDQAQHIAFLFEKNHRTIAEYEIDDCAIFNKDRNKL